MAMTTRLRRRGWPRNRTGRGQTERRRRSDRARRKGGGGKRGYNKGRVATRDDVILKLSRQKETLGFYRPPGSGGSVAGPRDPRRQRWLVPIAGRLPRWSPRTIPALCSSISVPIVTMQSAG